MAVKETKYKQSVRKVISSKSARITKATTANNDKRVTQARSQAKKIIQGLHEAAQIRSGKATAISFEEYFGAV